MSKIQDPTGILPYILGEAVLEGTHPVGSVPTVEDGGNIAVIEYEEEEALASKKEAALLNERAVSDG